ncbi:hypothetical protein Tco_0508669 [Tanacetum coccineum]
MVKNVSYDIVEEKTTYILIHALSNLYEKSRVSNKVYYIRQLVNTKIKEGGSTANHVNDYNSVLALLMSVDNTFDDEIHALLLPSSLTESYIHDLIIEEDNPQKTYGEHSNYFLSEEDRGTGTRKTKGRSKTKATFKNQCTQPITPKMKEAHVVARESDDALTWSQMEEDEM